MKLTDNTKPQYLQHNLITQDSRYSYYLNLANKIYTKLCDKYSLEYRPYQPEMASVYALRANNICAGSCGLGKTFIVGLLISILYTELKRPGQIQIAVPNKLSGQTRWLQDLNKIDCLKGKLSYIDNEAQALNSKAPIWVYTIDFIKRNTKSIGGSRATIDRLLKRRGLCPSLLVIDEVHLLKPNTDRSIHWLWWRKQCKRFLALSGTLSDGRLDLLSHILDMVYGKDMEYSKNEFLEEFRGAGTSIKSNYLRGEEQVSNISTRYLSHLDITKLPQYSNLAQRYIHRVSLNDPHIIDVVKVPTYTEYGVGIVPTIEHRTLYLNTINNIRTKLINAQSSNWTIALNVINPLLQISNNPSSKEVGVNRKLEKLLELVASCKNKTVVFVNQIDTARYLQQVLYAKYSINSLRLYAYDDQCNPKHLSASKREALVCRFLYDPMVRVGVFSINLASESIDLNVAEQVIFYDYPWQSIKLQQAIYRAVRPGSPMNHIKVYYLYNKGMIDQHQYNLLNERKKSSLAMLDFDPTALRGQDLSVINTSTLITRTINTEKELLENICPL